MFEKTNNNQNPFPTNHGFGDDFNKKGRHKGGNIDGDNMIGHYNGMQNKLEAEGELLSRESLGSNCPWWSIELIFNRSNIWANMRNFKPTSIYYELHNPDRWLPFIFENDSLKTGTPNSGDMEHLLANGPMQINCKPIGNTFSLSPISKAWDFDRIKKLELEITNKIKAEITNKRSSNKMATILICKLKSRH